MFKEMLSTPSAFPNAEIWHLKIHHSMAELKKMWFIYAMEFDSAIKKNKMVSFVVD